MTANGRVTLSWADGEHDFNLAKIGLVLELEDKCGCGVMEVFSRLREGRWRFNDIRETVRLGLIGGGKTPPQALLLTQRYVDVRPWQENVLTAQAVLMASIVGVPGDEVGKRPVEGTETEATEASALSAPQSTEPAPSSDGPQEKPTKRRSGSSWPASTPTIVPTGEKQTRRPPAHKNSTT